MKKNYVAGSLVAVLFALLLSACGGGGGGSAGSGPTATITGVAATGAAIAGTVTLKDAAGATRSATISLPSGSFTLDVSGLTPPYFLKASSNDSSITLYSVATGSGTFNINPLSNLIAVAAAMSIDPLAKTPDLAFNNPAGFAALTPAQIDAAVATVMAQMSPAFRAALADNGASNVNPLTGLFQVGNGLDRVFDSFVITLNPATGEVQQRQVVGGTTTVVGLVDMLGTFPGAGVYRGSVHSNLAGQSSLATVLVLASGEVRYVADNGTQIAAVFIASGSNVSGTGMAHAPTGSYFPDGSTVATLTLTGTLIGTNLTGSYSAGGDSGTFNFTRDATQTDSTSSLRKIAGTYASSLKSNAVFIGHIGANGNIWGSGPGITYSGRIDVIDPDANAYRVNLAYSRNGTYGYVSGTAFFKEAAIASALPMPTALVPSNYTGDVANMTYGQSTSGNQGVFVMQLSSALQPIFFEAVRLSAQQQSIAAIPASGSLMVQAISNEAFSITAVGDLQYSESAETLMISAAASISAGGSINVITNLGNITLSGPTLVTIPVTQGTIPATLPILQADSNSIINWQSFSIGSGSEVNFSQSGGSITVTNRVVGNGGTVITGTLVPDGQVSLINPNGITLNGVIASAGGGTIVTAGSGGSSGAGTISIAAGP